MSELFPMVAAADAGTTQTELPIYRDIAWDYEADAPVISMGNPVIVEGKEAVKSWAFRALSAVRGRFPIFTDQYGSDFEEIIGKAFSPELKEAECKRYCSETLLYSPYITDADVKEVEFEQGGKLIIRVEIKTVYGDEVIDYGG